MNLSDADEFRRLMSHGRDREKMEAMREKFVRGAVLSPQRPPTAKGICFLILEDKSGRLPTAMTPAVYEQFERVLREPGLLVGGRLEAPPEERRGAKTGIYRSASLDRIWSLDTLCQIRSVAAGQGIPAKVRGLRPSSWPEQPKIKPQTRIICRYSTS